MTSTYTSSAALTIAARSAAIVNQYVAVMHEINHGGKSFRPLAVNAIDHNVIVMRRAHARLESALASVGETTDMSVAGEALASAVEDLETMAEITETLEYIMADDEATRTVCENCGEHTDGGLCDDCIHQQRVEDAFGTIARADESSARYLDAHKFLVSNGEMTPDLSGVRAAVRELRSRINEGEFDSAFAYVRSVREEAAAVNLDGRAWESAATERVERAEISNADHVRGASDYLVCGDCVCAVEYGDMSGIEAHLDWSDEEACDAAMADIEASVEALGNVAHVGMFPVGDYWVCDVCKHDTMGPADGFASI